MSNESSSEGKLPSLTRLGGAVLNYLKKLPNKIKETLLIEDKATTCRHCRGEVRPPNEFCCQGCVLKYWKDLREKNGKLSEKWMCSMPGCDEPCWVEDSGKVHDYCTRKHAREHALIKERLGFGSACNTIYFYDKQAPFYEFTNFHWAPIHLDHKKWYTTEHYFQAQKFIGTPHLDVIQKLSSAREAFEYSRNPSVSRWCRKDWEDVKIKVMRKALLAKFTQHGELREVLLSTRGIKLVEHSPYDSFWGDGGDGKGENNLGKLLMEIRDDLLLYTQENSTARLDSGVRSSSTSGTSQSSSPTSMEY